MALLTPSSLHRANFAVSEISTVVGCGEFDCGWVLRLLGILWLFIHAAVRPLPTLPPLVEIVRSAVEKPIERQ